VLLWGLLVVLLVWRLLVVVPTTNSKEGLDILLGGERLIPFQQHLLRDLVVVVDNDFLF